MKHNTFTAVVEHYLAAILRRYRHDMIRLDETTVDDAASISDDWTETVISGTAYLEWLYLDWM